MQSNAVAPRLTGAPTAPRVPVIGRQRLSAELGESVGVARQYSAPWCKVGQGQHASPTSAPASVGLCVAGSVSARGLVPDCRARLLMALKPSSIPVERRSVPTRRRSWPLEQVGEDDPGFLLFHVPRPAWVAADVWPSECRRAEGRPWPTQADALRETGAFRAALRSAAVGAESGSSSGRRSTGTIQPWERPRKPIAWDWICPGTQSTSDSHLPGEGWRPDEQFHQGSQEPRGGLCSDAPATGMRATAVEARWTMEAWFDLPPETWTVMAKPRSTCPAPPSEDTMLKLWPT